MSYPDRESGRMESAAKQARRPQAPLQKRTHLVAAVVLGTVCLSTLGLWVAGCTTDPPLPPEETVTERDALVALYESTGGTNWIRQDGWLSEAELGDWYGIGTDDQGSVTRIVLNGNNLVGSLPSKLGVLTHLSRLSLQHNGLVGDIPAELGQLASIDTLDLYVNGLSGEIPQELLGLEEVSMLLLGFNQLSGPIPPGLGSMPYLERLWLNHNNFSGDVPPELGDLGARLQWLDFQENVGLQGALPRELIDLTGLVRFEWGGTSLCSPSDEEFQAWLRSVPNRYGHGPRCDP